MEVLIAGLRARIYEKIYTQRVARSFSRCCYTRYRGASGITAFSTWRLVRRDGDLRRTLIKGPARSRCCNNSFELASTRPHYAKLCSMRQCVIACVAACVASPRPSHGIIYPTVNNVARTCMYARMTSTVSIIYHAWIRMRVDCACCFFFFFLFKTLHDVLIPREAIRAPTVAELQCQLQCWRVVDMARDSRLIRSLLRRAIIRVAVMYVNCLDKCILYIYI